MLPDRLPPAELEWPPEEEPPPPPAEEEEWPELAERMDLCETETGFPDSADSSFAELTEACDSVFEPLSATEPPSLPVAASERLSSVAPLDAEEEEEPAEEDEEPEPAEEAEELPEPAEDELPEAAEDDPLCEAEDPLREAEEPEDAEDEELLREAEAAELLPPFDDPEAAVEDLEAFGGPAPAEDE